MDTANNGYSEAVSNGALAMLYKSATSFSLYTPHARRANLYYDNNPTIRKVPIAYITIEDSQLLSRISARGKLFWPAAPSVFHIVKFIVNWA